MLGQRHAEDRRAGAGGEARREVDLAQQQDEHQPHRQDHDRRALVEQVREVLLAKNVSGCIAEHDTSTTAPKIAGNDPRSPPLILSQYAPAASPIPAWPGIVSSRTARPAAVASPSYATPASAATCGCSPMSPGASGGDQLDHLRVVDVLGAHLGRHLPEYRRGDLSATWKTSFILCVMSTTPSPFSADRRTSLST